MIHSRLAKCQIVWDSTRLAKGAHVARVVCRLSRSSCDPLRARTAALIGSAVPFHALMSNCKSASANANPGPCRAADRAVAGSTMFAACRQLGGRFSKRTEGAQFLLAVSLGRDCCRQAGSELGLLAMRRLAAASFHYPHFSVCSTVKMHLLMHLQAGGMAVRTFLACCGLFLGASDPR